MFDLGLSKELKRYLFRILVSKHLVLNGHERTGQTYRSSRTEILLACNETVKQTKSELYVPGLVVDYSSSDSTTSLNGLFTSEGVFGMLEAKNYKHVDYGFLFFDALVDRIRGEKNRMTSVICIL